MEQTSDTIGIYVFSGTGNTLKCAKALETALTEMGVSVHLQKIADGSETAAERDLVICYPVYGFNMPRILKDFCRNLTTGEYDPEIIAALGMSKHLFHKLQQPGTAIGTYEGIKVVLCATHDTGSAVEGIPMEGNQPYISSGTWSLLGVKTPKPITDAASEAANWSNEGGVGYNRYQKNIMGMWLVNRLRSELCPEKPWSEITAEAEQSCFDETVDANAAAFLAPESMQAAFDAALKQKPQTAGDYFRCAYRSLALSYRQAIEELERNTGRTYDKLYIVGGGAKNGFLNRLTEQATGKTVLALPIEATALGNLKIQTEVNA